MTKKPLKVVTHGLNPTPDDDRDFLFGSIFPGFDIKQVPNSDFIVGNVLGVKDQALPGFNTDMCTAFGLAAVSELQEQVALDPNFIFGQIKKIIGDWKAYGGDLRSGCKVAVTIGAIEESQTPLLYQTVGRDFVANWLNWDKFAPDIFVKAKKHLKTSFVQVDGQKDTFDSFRAFLWQFKDDHRGIYTGCTWKGGWLHAQGGIIPDVVEAGGTGHCFAVVGQKMINGQPYLVIQNSYGTDVGDHGYHYMSRVVANRELTFRGYGFIDMHPDEVKKVIENNTPTPPTPPAPAPSPITPSMLKVIADFLKGIFQHFNHVHI